MGNNIALFSFLVWFASRTGLLHGPVQTENEAGVAMAGRGYDLTMMVEKRDKKSVKPMTPGQQVSSRQRSQQPEWTNSLRRLYNSVVEEPLPDSFADLIAKLDADDK